MFMPSLIQVLFGGGDIGVGTLNEIWMHVLPFKALKWSSWGFLFQGSCSNVAFWNSLARVDDKRCRETTMK